MSMRIKVGASMWGQMGSGIMFRHNGQILLQHRSSEVEESGQIGIPGGALAGTEGWYDSKSIPTPEIDDETLSLLWNSALKEVEEELGGVPKISQEQVRHVINWIDNWPYVTFVVDLNSDQVDFIDRILEDGGENWEAENHNWYPENERPDNLHHGVEYVLDELRSLTNLDSVTLSTEIPKGIIATAKDKWTQNQVYSDGDETYEIEILEKLTRNHLVENVKVSTLTPQLYDGEVWAEKDRQLSPMMVLTNPTFDRVTIGHMTDIRIADLTRPIFIRFSNGVILDGYHRLARAFIRGDRTIKAIFIQEEEMRQAIFSD